MNSVKISVVIAIYNIENYIRECIQSVVNQNFHDYEIILVDDGSKDSSGKICDEFASIYNNIFVFHKENGGLSDARNFGLKKAKGEYVLFVDGDDFISEEACCELYIEAINANADIVIGKAHLTNPSSSMERFEKIVTDNFSMHKVYNSKDYLLKCLENGALRVEAWRSLYRREFLIENNLFFKFGITHEDEEFTPRVLLLAKKIVLTDFEFYNYNNERQGSLMNSKNLKKAYDKMAIYDELLEIYKNVEPKKLRRLLEDDISWKYMDCCKVYELNKLKDFKIKRLLPLKCAFHFKRRIKAVVFAISPNLYNKYF